MVGFLLGLLSLLGGAYALLVASLIGMGSALGGGSANDEQAAEIALWGAAAAPVVAVIAILVLRGPQRVPVSTRRGLATPAWIVVGIATLVGVIALFDAFFGSLE